MAVPGTDSGPGGRRVVPSRRGIPSADAFAGGSAWSLDERR
ncbi:MULTISPECIES: hypothetical protein [Streptomyces violaceusniger group]|uniref:Uncharacterized protein n=1 Tax=Streptomyces antimycoticus TaxID=68175 RepID=A0ABD5J6V8_9ACTN|nr:MULTISPECIES: hypothetical protein [Streptomyces]MEE4583506.1 hypothetical protein [Streptomyces sp. DSM 41602]WJD96596.1 hypothetical protein QR300_11725 [Streptomyces antimycoticus]